MTAVDKNIEGLSDLLSGLRELPDKIETRLVSGALREGVKVFWAELGQNAPIRTGKLLRSVKIRVARRGKHPAVRLVVGDRRAYYVYMVEGGVAPHRIPARKTSLHFNGRFVRGGVSHPGYPGRHFIKNTFANASEDAVAAFKAYLNAKLPKEIARQQAGKNSVFALAGKKV